MRLQHQKESETARKLSVDELESILKDAIRRQGEQERLDDSVHVMTEDDLFEAARTLNVPEEHVLAALAESGKARTRPRRRKVVKSARLIGLIVAGVIFAITLPFAAFTFFPSIIAGLIALWTLLRYLSPVSDQEADRAVLPPELGTCQVCGMPAVAPNSTLCRAHTYRPPGS